MNSFLSVLPTGLSVEMSHIINERSYKNIDFFKNKNRSFMAYLCPRLKPQLFMGQEYICRDGDEVNCIYFLREGVIGNVLPHHFNIKYINYPVGSHFGVLDIVCSCLSKNMAIDDWVKSYTVLKREFTVMTQTTSELITLSMQDLEQTKEDFEN